MGLRFWKKSGKKTENRGSNPNSQANLELGRQPKPESQTPVVELKNETAKLSAGRAMLGEMTQTIKAVNEFKAGLSEGNLFDDGADEYVTGSDMGGVADILNTPAIQFILPIVAPYLPGLIEKYAGVKPTTPAPSVEVAAPSSAEASSPQPEQAATIKDASSNLKIALDLPGFLWTTDNIRAQLAPYGLGDLTDEDIRRLGQKLFKAKT